MKKYLLTLTIFIQTLFLVSTAAMGNTGNDLLYKDRGVGNWMPAALPFAGGHFHLITHGRSGQLLIEGQWRNAAQIAAFIQQRRLLGRAVRQLNIYGCEFAKGAAGQAAVQYLQKRLGIPVAASTNITGAGGDYRLETSNVEAGALFAGFTGSLQCPGTAGGTGPGDDFDGDGVCNDADLDDDNDGILDSKEDGAACGSEEAPFTSLEQARANVTTVTARGVYHFNLGGNTLPRSVAPGGYVLVAVDWGDGAGNLPTSAALGLDKATYGRGLLHTTTLGALGTVEQIRISSHSSSGGGIDATSTNAALIERVKTGRPLHRGSSSDNTINDSWTGTGSDALSVNATTSSGDDSLKQRVHGPGTSDLSTFFWRPAASNQRVVFNSGEIASTEYLALWVRGNSSGTPCNNEDDTDNDGILNRLDLDSDGDGCSDAFETGISGSLQPGTLMNSGGPSYSPNAIAQGGYGANGFADALETSENGVYTGSYANYTNATNNAVHTCPAMPLLRSDVNIGLTGENITRNLSTNDSIPSGSTYGSATTVPGYTNPGAATPAISTDGTYTFTSLDPGIYKFYIPVCPPSVSTGCPKELLTIYVLSDANTDNPPVVLPDYSTIFSGGTAHLATLANDRSGNAGQALDIGSVSITTFPKNGTAVVNEATGDIRYTPQRDFTGVDTLYYNVCDTASPSPRCASGFQVITVLPPTADNTVSASDDYASVLQNATVAGNVTDNDYDPEGGTLSVAPQDTTVSGVGTFVLNANGSHNFDPHDAFAGSVSFPYRVCDGVSPTPACKRATAYFVVNTPSSMATLPVRLVDFWGRHHHGANQLQWKTAQERNSAYFELRHSSHGSGFTTIATVQAAGNSNQVLRYQYLHTGAPAGNNFYQLVAVDKDGTRAYSEIITITTRRQGSVLLYPNPTHGIFILQGDRSELLSIRLYNATGTDVTGQVPLKKLSEEKVQISLHALPHGIYYVRTKTQGLRVVKR
ncbi:MAG: Ig-like domain-containing protein [Agriterribacter sp.]